MKAQFEKITTSRESSFKVFSYRDEQFNAPWHYHPELELTYIVGSSGLRYVGDNMQKFEEGDLVLLGSNLPHCWKNTQPPGAEARSIVIQWKEDLLGQGWLQKPEFLAIRNLLNIARRGVRFGSEAAATVEKMLFDILHKSPFYKLVFLLEMLDRLAASDDYILLAGNGFTPNLKFDTSERINHVYNFVSQNYRGKIALKQVASLVAMSEEAFCRFFKKTLNKTFFTFLNEYRINIACKFLIETDLQVTQIAYECGYESLPYFYRQFQKFVGCSPVSYKKEYQTTRN